MQLFSPATYYMACVFYFLLWEVSRSGWRETRELLVNFTPCLCGCFATFFLIDAAHEVYKMLSEQIPAVPSFARDAKEGQLLSLECNASFCQEDKRIALSFPAGFRLLAKIASSSRLHLDRVETIFPVCLQCYLALLQFNCIQNAATMQCILNSELVKTQDFLYAFLNAYWLVRTPEYQRYQSIKYQSVVLPPPWEMGTRSKTHQLVFRLFSKIILNFL